MKVSFKNTMAVILCMLILLMPMSVRAEDSTVEDFVARLYTLILERDYDDDGLKFWTGELKDVKRTGIYTAYGFLTSKEYLDRNKTDEEYVEDLYNAIMGRKSEEDGRNYWTKVLKEQTKLVGKEKARQDVFGSFCCTPEFTQLCEEYGIVRGNYYSDLNMDQTLKINLFVNRLYTVVLGRNCDTDGMTYWTDNLKTKTKTGKEVAGDFFLSKEYEDKNVSNDKYIDDLYRTLMGREGDDEGIAYWSKSLKDGTPRRNIYLGFADSEEFLDICNSYGIERGEVEKKDNGKVVCIDPGHSSVIAKGYVPLGPGSSTQKLADASGTSGRWSGLKEYELTMIISNQLKAELEARGYTVIMTRYDNNTPVDCVTRAQIANEGADISVRIHADALSSSSANGAVAICITPRNPWNPQTYEGSRKLADALISNYCSETGIRNRGVSEQDDMTGNNWSTVPCVLFEMGFMTNQSDDLKMADPEFQVKMVKGLADGIDEFFE